MKYHYVASCWITSYRPVSQQGWIVSYHIVSPGVSNVSLMYRIVGNVSRCASHRPQWWRYTSLLWTQPGPAVSPLVAIQITLIYHLISDITVHINPPHCLYTYRYHIDVIYILWKLICSLYDLSKWISFAIFVMFTSDTSMFVYVCLWINKYIYICVQVFNLCLC